MSRVGRPTGVRYLVVGATTLVAVLLYLDRFCISIAEVYIKQDLGLSDNQVGWMFSAFFWSYALAQVPSGWLTDRFGARVMLTMYVVIWSFFTVLTGMAGGFVALLLMRLGFGLGQAGAYPTCAALLSRWAPLGERGAASSVVSLGGRVGGALAPLLTGFALVAFVPLARSSLLSPSDLLDVRGLIRALDATATATSTGEDPWAPWKARLAQQLANHDRTLWLHRVAADAAVKAPPEVVVGLTKDLNAILGSRETLHDAPRQAAELSRQGQRLMHRDPAALSQPEVERLNRLLLEAAFPEDIRKLYTGGWRPAMLLYGVIGIPVAGFYWLVFRDRPGKHPWCNEAEVELIGRDLPAEQRDPAPLAQRIPWRALLTNISMWLNCLMQWATNVGWVFLVTWLPRYLVDVHRIPVEKRAVMTLIPVVVGFVGMLLGGRWTDRLVHSMGPRWGRSLPIALSRFLSMGAYLLCLLHPSPWIAVALFSVVAMGTDLGIGPTWAYVQDVGGRHVGSVLGWGNMWGNLGAALTPPLLIWVVGQENRNWDAAFLTCAAAFLVAGLAGLGIDATSRILDAPSLPTRSAARR